jgi:hypothetical protein
MNFRFLSAVVLLLVAFILQFFLATAGVFMNFFFATLIACAFLFSFWELLVLVLLAVFIVNWQPAVNVEIMIFALYPLAVFFLRGFAHLQLWLKNLIAIFVGIFLLYAVLGGRAFLFHPTVFLIDVLGGMVFGSAVFLLLAREA